MFHDGTAKRFFSCTYCDLGNHFELIDGGLMGVRRTQRNLYPTPGRVLTCSGNQRPFFCDAPVGNMQNVRFALRRVSPFRAARQDIRPLTRLCWLYEHLVHNTRVNEPIWTDFEPITTDCGSIAGQTRQQFTQSSPYGPPVTTAWPY